MSKQNEENATCIICGKKYHLCIACERTNANWKQWRVITDTENCYNIYKILNDYNFKKISKDEARKLFKNVDLKDLNTFKDNVKKQILEITQVKKSTRNRVAENSKENEEESSKCTIKDSEKIDIES